MIRRLLGGVLLVSLAAGCGIPGSTEVQVEQRGPAAETSWSLGRGSEPPARAASGSDAGEFVENFLAAAAGEPDRAYDRVKQFIAPADRNGLQEKQGSEVALSVVRLTDAPVIEPDIDSMQVTITVQQVGVLRANGTLATPVSTEPTYEFRLVSAGPPGQEDAGYYVADPPNVLLLSDEALDRYYQRETIYFWNSGRTRLVPDQRYLPLAVPAERRVSEVVRWLTAGPSDWLGFAAARLPDRTEMINNATGSDGRWEVNLDMPTADDQRLEQFATQLAWSLAALEGELEIKILNQSRMEIDLARQRLANPVYALGDDPQRFCVYEGAVHPLAFHDGIGGPVPVVEAVNQDALSAGMIRVGDEVLAALVVAGDDGKQRLRVGRGGAPPEAFQVSEAYGAVGRPVWVRSTGDRPHGLVVADRRLHRFDERGVMRPVQLTVAGDVTAVAAALDGHRVALVVGGRLYVAAVTAEGGVPVVGPTRPLVTSLVSPTAVDWLGENRLVVAGSAGRPAIYEISVDGALETALRQDVGTPVTHLASYPANPMSPLVSGAYMYEANGVSYRSNPVERIQREQVQQVTPPPAGARPGNPTAPFFLF
ncbi:Sporulation and spore germination [Micromonospora nigra]|uniref:Sporulation and spore germination n=1 Tax=Micromonospora nigra TaxID=145857 RepID=A0A1C6SFY4_9ACTN|nr:LpqB family beta-propeller domain-containing protein [Micromonospora nigra]SCL28258.1 Sporulation and spore germination [Micromonospora nigra]